METSLSERGSHRFSSVSRLNLSILCVPTVFHEKSKGMRSNSCPLSERVARENLIRAEFEGRTYICTMLA